MAPRSSFLKLRGPDGQASRTQDNIDAVLGPIAKALGATPIMGAAAPPWVPLALRAGWTGSLNTNQAAYHKDALGYVHLKAYLINATGGASTGPIADLPVGFRPGPRRGDNAALREVAMFPAIVTIPLGNAILITDGTISAVNAVGGAATIGFYCTFLAEN